MTVGAKNNYARAIKLDLTFCSFGFYIFEVFSSLLSSRRRLQDIQTETIQSERVDNHLSAYAGVLKHAQQQDKLNAKRLIHGICSIFRFFRYQINKAVQIHQIRTSLQAVLTSYSRTDLNDLVSLIFTSLLMLLTGKHSDAIKLNHG